MSGIKRVIEDNEAKRADALQFALDLGVLKRCGFHDSVYEGSGDLDHAYRAAAASFKRGEHGLFANQREFTDYIQVVVQDHSADVCPGCDKWQDE